jgi:hypothetical protein
MVASGESSRFVCSGTVVVAEESRAYSTMEASGDSARLAHPVVSSATSSRFAQPVVSSVRSSRLPQLVSKAAPYSMAVASLIAKSQQSMSSKPFINSAHQVRVYHALG